MAGLLFKLLEPMFSVRFAVDFGDQKSGELPPQNMASLRKVHFWPVFQEITVEP